MLVSFRVVCIVCCCVGLCCIFITLRYLSPFTSLYPNLHTYWVCVQAQAAARATWLVWTKSPELRVVAVSKEKIRRIKKHVKKKKRDIFLIMLSRQKRTFKKKVKKVRRCSISTMNVLLLLDTMREMLVEKYHKRWYANVE